MGAEISHMLPGGLDIIGIFIIASAFDKALPKMLKDVSFVQLCSHVAWLVG